MIRYEPGFPKQMVHPQYAPALFGADGQGNITGTSVRFPPEQAHTPNAEEELRSRGYLAVGEAPSMTAYVEYPLMMVHPNHVDAIDPQTGAVAENGALKTFAIPGSPEKFPHAFVNNNEEERTWQAKGYQRAGQTDPQAFDKATVAPGMPGAEWPKWMDGVLMDDPDKPAPPTVEFPKYVTLPNGDSVIVNSRQEEESLLGPRLEPPKPVEPPSVSDDELAEFRAWKASRSAPKASPEELGAVRAELDAAGIAYDKRWGLAKLKAALETSAAA